MNTPLKLKTVRRLLQSEIVLVDNDKHDLGVVTQVFLHPSNGIILGVALQLAARAPALLIAVRYLLFADTPFANDRATVLTDAFTPVEELAVGATTYQNFLGTEIVSDDGQLCGLVEEVYFDEEGLQTIYQIKRPGLQGLLRRKYYVAGREADFYSHRFHRLTLAQGATLLTALPATLERNPVPVGLKPQHSSARLPMEDQPARRKVTWGI